MWPRVRAALSDIDRALSPCLGTTPEESGIHPAPEISMEPMGLEGRDRQLAALLIVVVQLQRPCSAPGSLVVCAAWWVKAPIALAEDLGLILSTHKAAHNHL